MKLLLAEDERDLSRALSVILRHEGYEVTIADNGREALDCCEKENFDGYVFDIMMPFMDGITLLETLRSKGDRTPALFLTAKSTTEDCIRGLDSGADDYLTKPFAMGELLARVRVLLRRHETGKKAVDEPLIWANISLDVNQQVLESANMRLVLTPDETKLLALLIRHSGQPMQADELLKALGGAENQSFDLYVDYLERKLSFVGADGHLVRQGDQVWIEADRS